MIALSLIGCLDAAADPPVQWEYAHAQAYATDCLLIETGDSSPIPKVDLHTTPKAVAAACAKDAQGEVVRVPHIAAAMDYLGAQGWELVLVQGTDVYFKRRK